MSADCVLNNWRVDVASGSEYFPVRYGLLYNWYAATDVRNIAADGWHVPSLAEYTIFYNYCGGSSGGDKVGDIDGSYWTDSSIYTNEYKLNIRGSGRRGYLSVFSQKDSVFWAWLSNSYNAANGNVWGLFNVWFQTQPPGSILSNQKYHGQSVRLIKNTTTLTHGQYGIYVGNDGRIYRTICIGTQEWLADNLCETLYRNGDPIPEVTDNAAWAALTTGARCSYDNDWNNV